MVELSLTEEEIKVLRMSLMHCMETCREGGRQSGCSDCEKLEAIMGKLGRVTPS